MAVIIWHNPRCSKSRQTLALIEDHAPTIRLYLTDAPSRAELEALNIAPANLIRKGEKLFKELALKGVDDDALLEAMTQHPILIERPVVINGPKAALGRPPEAVLDIL